MMRSTPPGNESGSHVLVVDGDFRGVGADLDPDPSSGIYGPK